MEKTWTIIIEGPNHQSTKIADRAEVRYANDPEILLGERARQAIKEVLKAEGFLV